MVKKIIFLIYLNFSISALFNQTELLYAQNNINFLYLKEELKEETKDGAVTRVFHAFKIKKNRKDINYTFYKDESRFKKNKPEDEECVDLATNKDNYFMLNLNNFVSMYIYCKFNNSPNRNRPINSIFEIFKENSKYILFAHKVFMNESDDCIEKEDYIYKVHVFPSYSNPIKVMMEMKIESETFNQLRSDFKFLTEEKEFICEIDTELALSSEFKKLLDISEDSPHYFMNPEIKNTQCFQFKDNNTKIRFDYNTRNNFTNYSHIKLNTNKNVYYIRINPYSILKNNKIMINSYSLVSKKMYEGKNFKRIKSDKKEFYSYILPPYNKNGDYELTPQMKIHVNGLVNEIVELIENEQKQLAISIFGYADDKGFSEYSSQASRKQRNKIVSQRRANAVKDRMLKAALFSHKEHFKNFMDSIDECTGKGMGDDDDKHSRATQSMKAVEIRFEILSGN